MVPVVSICALLAVRDEIRCIQPTLEYLLDQQIDVVVLDNESSDGTEEILRQYERVGAIRTATFPYHGAYSQRAQMEAKADVADSLSHDWVVHHDADELLQGRQPGQGLRDVLEEAHDRGYEALNFEEFVFVPPAGESSVDGLHHQDLLHYYLFAPSDRRLVRAVRRHLFSDLVDGLGHRLDRPGTRVLPESQVLRHYLCLSIEHLREKYQGRVFDADETAVGAHVERVRLTRLDPELPASTDLHVLATVDSQEFDRSNPRNLHFWEWGDRDPGPGEPIPIIDDDDPRSLDEFVGAARSADEARDWPTALSLWAAVREQHPGHMWAELRLSLLHGEMGEHHRAESMLVAARRRWPDEAAPLLVAAQLASRARDWSTAAERWRSLLDVDPENVWALPKLAEALSGAGEYGSLTESVRSPRCRLEGGRAPILVLARTATIERDWSTAAACWAALLASDPDDQASLRGSAQAAVQLGDPERAVVDLTSLAGLVPLDRHESFALARLQAARGDLGAAHRELVGLADGLAEGSVDGEDPEGALPVIDVAMGLISCGDLDTASVVLQLDPERAWPRSAEASEEGGVGSSAVVIDPSLIRFGGHDYNLTRFYRDRLRDLGASEVSVYMGRGPAGSEVSDQLKAVRHFQVPSMVPDHWLATSIGVQSFNDRFRAEMHRDRRLAGHRVVLHHSCRVTNIAGLAGWLSDTDSLAGRLAVLGIIETAFLAPDHQHTELVVGIYRTALEAMADLRDTRVVLTAETKSGRDFLRSVAPEAIDVLRIPYEAAARPAGDVIDPPAEALGRRTGSETITIGFLGATRPGRGPDLMVEVVRALLETSGYPVEFVLQIDPDLVGMLHGRSKEVALRRLGEHDSVRLLPADLPEADYRRWLDRIQVLVLPYRAGYRYSGSGLFYEGLAAGLVQVLPEHTSMAADADELGAGAVLFSEPTVRAITMATAKAIGDFEPRRQSALEAAGRWLASRHDEVRLESAIRSTLSPVP